MLNECLLTTGLTVCQAWAGNRAYLLWVTLLPRISAGIIKPPSLARWELFTRQQLILREIQYRTVRFPSAIRQISTEKGGGPYFHSVSLWGKRAFQDGCGSFQQEAQSSNSKEPHCNLTPMLCIHLKRSKVRKQKKGKLMWTLPEAARFCWGVSLKQEAWICFFLLGGPPALAPPSRCSSSHPGLASFIKLHLSRIARPLQTNTQSVAQRRKCISELEERLGCVGLLNRWYEAAIWDLQFEGLSLGIFDSTSWLNLQNFTSMWEARILWVIRTCCFCHKSLGITLFSQVLF